MALDVTRLELGPFPVNCYVVRRPGASEAVVVDPGWPGEAPRIVAALGGASCAAILVTHGDLDHIGAVADVAEETGAPVYIADEERELLERAPEFVPAAFRDVPIRSWTPERLLAGDECFEIGGIEFETLFVPGHTRAHVAYATDGAVFSGDVLFAGGIGRTDRPGGDSDQLLQSIRLLAERLPAGTVVYPGHGPATTLGDELATNPFLAGLRAS
jgi:hydroxyacylglutathione hydrolase